MEIARKVGISGAAIHLRLRKLEGSGLLKGSQFILDPFALGYNITAFISVATQNNINTHLIVKQLEAIPEVLACHILTGEFPILVKALAKDYDHLLELQNNKLNTIKGISKVKVQISLKQEFDRQMKV